MKPIKTITDETLLSLIKRGILRGEQLNYCPRIYFRNNQLTPTICGTDGVNGTRYRVEIRYEGVRRTILLSKLVWMLGHHRIPPADHEIHHKDEDRYHDSFHNLELQHIDYHRRYHNGLS